MYRVHDTRGYIAYSFDCERDAVFFRYVEVRREEGGGGGSGEEGREGRRTGTGLTDENLKKCTAYMTQGDTLHIPLTVRETLYFSAMLR
jgi:hypothetical protein